MARMLLIHWMKSTIIRLLIIFLKSVNNKNIDSNITETVFYEKHIFSYLEYPPPYLYFWHQLLAITIESYNHDLMAMFFYNIHVPVYCDNLRVLSPQLSSKELTYRLFAFNLLGISKL